MMMIKVSAFLRCEEHAGHGYRPQLLKEAGILPEMAFFSRAPLKIQSSLSCCVAPEKLLLTYQTYAASQFFARALPDLED
jgi:hypothetical protein